MVRMPCQGVLTPRLGHAITCSGHCWGPEHVLLKRAAHVVLEAHRLSKKEHRTAVGREVLGEEEILERIRVASEQDEQFAAVHAKDQAPAAVRNKLKEWDVVDGLVGFRGLIAVPDEPEIKRLILALYHDSIPAGHPGRAKTLELVMRNFWWPRQSEFVYRYVDGCDLCQRSKPRRQKPFGPLQPLEIPEGLFHTILSDYIGPLPVSGGFDQVMVVVDKMTKLAHFILV